MGGEKAGKVNEEEQPFCYHEWAKQYDKITLQKSIDK